MLYLNAQIFIVQWRKNERVYIRQKKKKKWVKLSYIKNLPMSGAMRLNQN